MVSAIIIKSQSTDIIRPFSIYSWCVRSWVSTILWSYWPLIKEKSWVIPSGKPTVLWVWVGTMEKKWFLSIMSLSWFHPFQFSHDNAHFLLSCRGDRSILGTIKWKTDENRGCSWRLCHTQIMETSLCSWWKRPVCWLSINIYSDRMKMTNVEILMVFLSHLLKHSVMSAWSFQPPWANCPSYLRAHTYTHTETHTVFLESCNAHLECIIKNGQRVI